MAVAAILILSLISTAARDARNRPNHVFSTILAVLGLGAAAFYKYSAQSRLQMAVTKLPAQEEAVVLRDIALAHTALVVTSVLGVALQLAVADEPEEKATRKKKD